MTHWRSYHESDVEHWLEPVFPSVSSYQTTLPLLSINAVFTTSLRHWKYHGEQETLVLWKVRALGADITY